MAAVKKKRTSRTQIAALFRQAINKEADEIRRTWLFQRPRLVLPSVLSLSPEAIKKGAIKPVFPGWYRLKQVPQSDHKHKKNVQIHTLATLEAFRDLVKKPPVEGKIERLFLQQYLQRPQWGLQRQDWIEWFILLHDVGKLTTGQQRREVMLFSGHEMAGVSLLERWLTAIELLPAAHDYLTNMVGAHGLIDALLDDTELSYRGILIHARKICKTDEQLLDLLLFTIANRHGSQMKRRSKAEFVRREQVTNAALGLVLREMSEMSIVSDAEEASIADEDHEAIE